MRIPQGNKWSWKRNRTKMAILKKSMERNDDYSTTPIKFLTNTTEQWKEDDTAERRKVSRKSTGVQAEQKRDEETMMQRIFWMKPVEQRKDKDTIMQSEFFTNTAEERKDQDTIKWSKFSTESADQRKDEDTIIQREILTKPAEDRKDNYTTNWSEILNKYEDVQAGERKSEYTIMGRKQGVI